jgi:PAS domain S-box-containing protein
VLVERATDAMIVVNPADVILEVNGKACELFGYTRDELVGMDYPRLVDPEDLKRLPPQVGAAFAGASILLERRYVRKDGTRFDGELSNALVNAQSELCIIRDITERKRIEAALACREREYRLLLQEAYDAILVIDPDCRIVEANGAMARLLGCTQEELRGRHYASLVEPEDLARQPLRIAETFANGRVSMERRLVRKDGSVVDVELGSARIDERRLLTILRDVTERERTQAALRESEELFRTLLGAVFDGIVIHEGERIVEANAAFERLLGYSRDELLQRDFLSLVAPESRPVLRRLRGRGTPEPFEITALHKDGRTVFLECIAQTRLRNGRTTRVKALRDITQRKRDELALRTSEAHLRQAQEIARLGSWALELDTNQLTMSEECSRVLGLESHERVLPVERIWPIVHPDDLERVQCLYQEIVAGWRDAIDIEFRLRGKAGHEPVVHSRGALVRDEGGRALRMIGTLQDLTEPKAMERQLAQAMKLEAIGKLTGGVAHDFNNLLTIILGNLRLLEQGVGPGNDFLAEALRAAERGAHLVQRLLAYGRRQPLQTRPLDAGRLIDETADLLRRTLGETIVLETRLTDDLWPARTDRSQLETALINLALNARDAMPAGGRLTIDADNRSLPRQEGLAAGAKPGDYVRIAVADTGTGMPPQVLERVFEPFFTTKEVGRGSGLGLSMVYGFAEQTGGFVQIRSREGDGTTVALFLPRSDEPPAPPRPSPAAARPSRQPRPASGGDTTVLVVEDDPGVRLVTALTLRTLGYRVLDAPNSTDALRMLADLPQVDLLFTDIVMPDGLTGVELAREAQRVRPGLPVLLTTGYAGPLLGPVGGPGGPWPLLPKPYDAEQLQARLDEVLRTTATTD